MIVLVCNNLRNVLSCCVTHPGGTSARHVFLFLDLSLHHMRISHLNVPLKCSLFSKFLVVKKKTQKLIYLFPLSLSFSSSPFSPLLLLLLFQHPWAIFFGLEVQNRHIPKLIKVIRAELLIDLAKAMAPHLTRLGSPRFPGCALHTRHLLRNINQYYIRKHSSLLNSNNEYG